MKNEKSIKVYDSLSALLGLFWGLSVTFQGCMVWQHESHLEDVPMAPTPQTQAKYWIRVLPSNTLSSTADWEKCLAIYERQVPSVFAPNGVPVFVELESAFQYTPNLCAVFVNMLAACTVWVVPMCYGDEQTRYHVHVSLDERQKNFKTFTVEGSWREWCGLLAPLFPMPEVKDGRFLHSDMNGKIARQEYASGPNCDNSDGYTYELFNGEADAIVHGVALMLQQFEAEWKSARRSRRIGD